MVELLTEEDWDQLFELLRFSRAQRSDGVHYETVTVPRALFWKLVECARRASPWEKV